MNEINKTLEFIERELGRDSVIEYLDSKIESYNDKYETLTKIIQLLSIDELYKVGEELYSLRRDIDLKLEEYITLRREYTDEDED